MSDPLHYATPQKRPFMTSDVPTWVYVVGTVALVALMLFVTAYERRSTQPPATAVGTRTVTIAGGVWSKDLMSGKTEPMRGERVYLYAVDDKNLKPPKEIATTDVEGKFSATFTTNAATLVQLAIRRTSGTFESGPLTIFRDGEAAYAADIEVSVSSLTPR